ncbi:MAG: class I SAM-dependent methyltransferase [Dehalococcoidia bacterium]
MDACSAAAAVPAEAAVLEQNPSLHLTIFEISAEAIARREQELGGRFPGRVELREQDLNFVDLPEAGYDLVLSNSCMHHLLNLEHVAGQVNRCLTDEGRFFLHDYVGESRFQFSDEKKRLFEAFIEEGRRRRPELRAWRVMWPDVDHWERYSPFEAIRSGDTLDVLGRFLGQERLRTAGAFFPLMLFLRPTEEAAGQRPVAPGRIGRLARRLAGRWQRRRRGGLAGLIEEMASDLVREDRRLSDAGELRPGMAFAVYRKKGSAD